MKILAVEFSSAQRSVAVVRGDAAHTALAANEVVQAGAGATRSLAMVDEALRDARLEREEMERLVVGIGPGSYTGIRSAIALAQGWQLAFGHRGIRLLGISSAECLATQARVEGLTGRVTIVIDAQRQEFYLAAYELGDGGCREVEPLRLATLTEVRQREDAGEVLVGPEVTRWFPRGRMLFPRAAALGRLALTRDDFVPAERLEPIYLRETQFIKAPPPRILR